MQDMCEIINEVFVIGVFGGTNSGKTTLVRILQKEFDDDVQILSQDSFYKTANHDTNFDDPSSIDFDLLVRSLEELKTGKTVDIPIYDFATHSRKEETQKLKSKKIIIIEGILIMTSKELADMCDVKIYVHAELDTMYVRRCDRDIKERGRTLEQIKNQWNRDVKPMHLKYVYPSRQEAHIIINNDHDQILTNPTKIHQINMVIIYIENYINASKYFFRKT